MTAVAVFTTTALPPVPPTEVALAFVPAQSVAVPAASATRATAGPADESGTSTGTAVPAAVTSTDVPPTRTLTAVPHTSLPSSTATAPPPSSTPSAIPTATLPAATRTPAPTATASLTPPPTPLPPSATASNTAAPPTSPPPPGPAPLADFWGINGGPIDGNNSTTPLDGSLAYSPALRAKNFYWMNQAGLRWFRNYGSDDINYSWRFVEPKAGVYDWSAWDALVRAAQQKDVTLLASIGNSVPGWANGNADWRVPPSDLNAEPLTSSAWYQYVQHVVERYDGDGKDDMPGLTRPVKFWELWNEPDLRNGSSGPSYPPAQFAGSAKDYVRLSQVGYAAVKAADPSAQVVGPSTAQMIGATDHNNGVQWSWADWMAAGGLKYVDIVSFHHYFDSTSWDATGQVDSMLNGLDANRGGKPVWVTEVGWDGGASSDYQVKDRNLVRSVVIFWQRPSVGRYFWYDLQESETYDGSHQKGFLQTLSGGAARGVEPDPLFHPVFRVAQVMARLLAGFGSGYHPAALDVGQAARAYHFSRPGAEVWVAWQRGADGTTTINLDTGGRTVRVIGLNGEDQGTFGGGALTIGPAPVYLTTQLNWNPNLGTITGRVRDGSQAGQWSNGISGATVSLSGPRSEEHTS